MSNRLLGHYWSRQRPVRTVRKLSENEFSDTYRSLSLILHHNKNSKGFILCYFLIICPNIDEHRVAAVAGRHRTHLALPHHFQLSRQLPHLCPQMNTNDVCVVTVIGKDS